MYTFTWVTWRRRKIYNNRALAISMKELGPEHFEIAVMNSNLGVVHTDLGDLEQAKMCYDNALAILLKKLGPDHSAVKTVQYNIAELQQKQQK